MLDTERAKFVVVCRFIQHDQWLTTHVEPTWTVRQLKLWLVHRLFQINIPSRVFAPSSKSDNYAERPPSPIIFASPERVSTGGLFSDSDSDATSSENSASRFYNARRKNANGREGWIGVADDYVPGTKFGPESEKELGASLRHNFSQDEAEKYPGGVIPGHWTIIRYSTGQVFEDDSSLGGYDIAEYELLELHGVSFPSTHPLHKYQLLHLWNRGRHREHERLRKKLKGKLEAEGKGANTKNAAVHAHILEIMNLSSDARPNAGVAEYYSSRLATPVAIPITRIPRSIDVYVQPYWEGWVRMLRVVYEGDQRPSEEKQSNRSHSKRQVRVEWRERWVRIQNNTLAVLKEREAEDATHILRLRDIMSLDDASFLKRYLSYTDFNPPRNHPSVHPKMLIPAPNLPISRPPPPTTSPYDESDSDDLLSSYHHGSRKREYRLSFPNKAYLRQHIQARQLTPLVGSRSDPTYLPITTEEQMTSGLRVICLQFRAHKGRNNSSAHHAGLGEEQENDPVMQALEDMKERAGDWGGVRAQGVLWKCPLGKRMEPLYLEHARAKMGMRVRRETNKHARRATSIPRERIEHEERLGNDFRAQKGLGGEGGEGREKDLGLGSLNVTLWNWGRRTRGKRGWRRRERDSDFAPISPAPQTTVAYQYGSDYEPRHLNPEPAPIATTSTIDASTLHDDNYVGEIEPRGRGGEGSKTSVMDRSQDKRAPGAGVIDEGEEFQGVGPNPQDTMKNAEDKVKAERDDSDGLEHVPIEEERLTSWQNTATRLLSEEALDIGTGARIPRIVVQVEVDKRVKTESLAGTAFGRQTLSQHFVGHSHPSNNDRIGSQVEDLHGEEAEEDAGSSASLEDEDLDEILYGKRRAEYRHGYAYSSRGKEGGREREPEIQGEQEAQLRERKEREKQRDVGLEKGREQKGRWVCLDIGNDFAFQSFLRIIHRHCPHPMRSSFMEGMMAGQSNDTPLPPQILPRPLAVHALSAAGMSDTTAGLWPDGSQSSQTHSQQSVMPVSFSMDSGIRDNSAHGTDSVAKTKAPSKKKNHIPSEDKPGSETEQMAPLSGYVNPRFYPEWRLNVLLQAQRAGMGNIGRPLEMVNWGGEGPVVGAEMDGTIACSDEMPSTSVTNRLSERCGEEEDNASDFEWLAWQWDIRRQAKRQYVIEENREAKAAWGTRAESDLGAPVGPMDDMRQFMQMRRRAEPSSIVTRPKKHNGD